MIKPSRIAIVGGGLAGSLMAIHLAELGHDVEVLEKRSDLRSSDAPAGRSINLAISERGLTALGRVGLRDRVLPITIPMRGRMIHAIDGKTHLQPYSQNPDEFIRSVSRADLNRLLLEEADTYPNVQINFETDCEAIILESNEISLRSGRATVYDGILGADGAGSVIRRTLSDAGKVSTGTAFLEHGYKELTILPDESGAPQLALEALHIWPRGDFMLIALPNLDGSFTCTLFMPLTGPVSFEALQNSGVAGIFLHEQFPDAARLMPDLAQQFKANPVGTLGTVRCTPWSSPDSDGRNMCLIGDAAHAIVPFFGQGMNCAFEDCTVLRDVLDDQPDSWGEAFSRFSESRIPDANAIADMALENYSEMRAHVNDPAFTLKREVGFELERRFPGHFIPRYSLVSFHTMPYAQVQERGRQQKLLLDRITADAQVLADIDWSLAETELKKLI